MNNFTESSERTCLICEEPIPHGSDPEDCPDIKTTGESPRLLFKLNQDNPDPGFKDCHITLTVPEPDTNHGSRPDNKEPDLKPYSQETRSGNCNEVTSPSFSNPGCDHVLCPQCTKDYILLDPTASKGTPVPCPFCCHGDQRAGLKLR